MALNQSDSQDFVLEVIGILGNLELPDLDYSQILHRCDLIPWIRTNLVPGLRFTSISISFSHKFSSFFNAFIYSIN